MFCTGLSQPFISLFSPEIPSLLYYSHVPAAIVSLLLGFLIFRFGDKKKSSLVLLMLTFAFFLLFATNIIIWISGDVEILTLFWFINQFVFLLLPVFSLYLFYIFLKDEKGLPFLYKTLGIIVIAAFIPIVFWGYNMQYFDVYNCEVVENSLIVSYQNSVLLLSVLWMFILTIKELFIKNEKKSEKTKTVLLALGLSSMLFSLFFTWNPTIFGYSAGFEEFGFIGMIVFLVTVTYMVVKYKAFNIKLLATQALIWGLIALIGSQFFFIRTPINRVLNGITFAASIILGYYLVKSVKKEIEQRKQLAFLLKQRESLVHLITHKVKGSFTRIKFLFAGMLDGTFGEISSEIKKRAEQGLEFDDNGIQTVDLVLNVANMQNGLIKYDMKTTDFRNLVEETISEKKISAEKKGLVIETKIEDGTYSVTGDSFWLKEVVNNLLENSIKYTKEGKIMVDLKKHNNKILFSVKDNGVGINEEDKKHLFTEGGRGAKSVEINVDSTGYGLFTVKLIVDAHAGRVWAESEGENKGSQFYVELPTI